MQALAQWSDEGGRSEGLGWLEAGVVRLEPGVPGLRVPQVGWNDVEYRADSPLFAGVPPRAEFYFVHSYHLVCDDPALVQATCEHGQAVTAAVRHGNVFATQFHPERSQDHGLTVLGNFLAWTPSC